MNASTHLTAVGPPGCVYGAHVLTQMLVPDDVEMLSASRPGFAGTFPPEEQGQ